MQSLVSIIIPTYNRAHLIGETLESVIAQTYNKWECIIVDDGSSDATGELMEFYCKMDSRIQYHSRPASRIKGANACRNYGFELCKGEFVNWFDSDDIMHPHKLSSQVSLLENKQSNLCVCQTVVFENSIENVICKRFENIYSNDLPLDYVTGKVGFLTQAPLWRKEFLKNNNYLFDESLQAGQEWEFHCRVLLRFPNYEILNKPLVYLRRHKANISSQSQEKLLKDYYLAHLRVFKLYESNSILSDKYEEYFLNYFKKSYRQALKMHKEKLALAILMRTIIKSPKVPSAVKLNYLLALGSYSIFGRGYMFLKN